MADTHGSADSDFDLTQFYQVFFEEAAENLDQMEQMLLNLDLTQANDEELNGIFRCAHSIKGGSATFGFTDVAELTHKMESLLDRLRRHEITPIPEMVDALLESADASRSLLARHQAGGVGEAVATGDLVRRIVDLAAARDQWLVLIQYAQKHSSAQLIAAKMETVEQFELLQQMGVKLFQGFWFARPSVFEAKILAPRQTSLVELITLLRRQASTDELEEVLKKDAGLAFNLLRLINSASFGMQREVTSFRQAVLIMGLKKLFRWAALLLAATKYANTPPSLGQTAVVRGRLMELLAEEFLSEEEADMAFVTGIFSLLDLMLSIPTADALQLIHAPEPIRQALLHQVGPLADLLTLAKACENNNDSVFDEAAEKLGLTNQQINWAHLRALAWSDQVNG